MDLRSSRSRSRTPVIRTSMSKEMVESGNHIGVGQTIIRTTRSTTTKTFSSDIDNITNVNHVLETQSLKPVKMKNAKSEKVTRKSRYKTSDYSSEDGDQQVTSTRTLEQNSANQFIEDARRSVSRSSGSHVSALDFYRAAGDYWNKFPKTDYTYSQHSRDRTEIAPGVVAMPNMSRKSLHNYDSYSDYVTSNKQTNTESFDHEEVDYSTNSSYNHSELTSNNNSDNSYRIRSRTLYSNNNYGDKYSVSRASSFKKTSLVSRTITTFTSFFVTIFTWISTLAYYVYSTQNSGFIWLGKKFHTVTTRLMLWDTWLLKSSTQKKKLASLLALCLIPLGLLAGLHVLLASGVPLAPPCHPHCGRIASSYVNTLIDSAYDTLHYFKTQP